jgi:hypothetical protein
MQRTTLLAVAATTFISLASAFAVTSTVAQQAPGRGPSNYPDYPTPSTTYRCEDELGHLRRVYEQELAGIRRPERVWVVPICREHDGMFRTIGNAGALRAGISKNPAIRAALKADNFRPEDVVAIRMKGDDSATIYVHPFHR